MRNAKPNSERRHRPISPRERARLGSGAEVASLPRAHGPPPVRGVMRREPEDFIVEEQLPFCPSGDGEHLYLRILKSGHNTSWVARQLARHFGLPPRAVGFAGLKDRRAAASQWFSVHLPGCPDPDPDEFVGDGFRVLESSRHTAKLRTGALSGNRFRIVIRQLSGDRDALSARLKLLRGEPVPNYFGAQRFGRSSANLDLLSRAGHRPDRESRSFGLSALRSAMFNAWLANRVEADTWRDPQAGEICFRPSTGRFMHESARTAGGDDACPTGLLFGAGDNRATGPALAAERAFFGSYPDAIAILREFEPRMMRRSLCLFARSLEFELREDALELSFALSRGQFATVLIREFGEFFDCA